MPSLWCEDLLRRGRSGEKGKIKKYVKTKPPLLAVKIALKKEGKIRNMPFFGVELSQEDFAELFGHINRRIFEQCVTLKSTKKL